MLENKITTLAPQLERRAISETLSLSEITEQVSGFVRRQLPIFLFVNAFAICLGLAYLFTAPSKYTSKAMLMIDSNKVRMLQQQQSTLGEAPLDTAQVETQVEVLKSESIGLAVIKELSLTDDPEFVGARGGLLGALFNVSSWFSSEREERSEYQKTRQALRVFLSQRTISRVGRTYVLDIAFTSLNRDRAAVIANAVADAYIVDQLEAKYQATRRASGWLQDRIKELRLQASAADRAVLDYKEKNNIIDAGSATSATGRVLLGDQQLSELNSQLTQARAAKAEAKARLDRIVQVREQDIPDAGVVDSLRSEVITRLRNNYLDMSARERIWAKRYGENHLAAVNLRNQMAELRSSIADELNRIAESYKSDYEIASTREKNIDRALAGLVTEAQSTSRDRLGLRDLEAQAQVYHTIHDNFLQRYMEGIQQQSFPITEARLISAAAPPNSRSSPQSMLVLAVALALGLIVSAVVAMLREALDRVFRTTRQVEELLQTSCLAVLPVLKGSASAPPSETKFTQRTSSGQIEVVEKSRGGSREFLRHVVDEPLSSFAEAFRAIKVAADINSDVKDTRVIGVISTVPAEGKSTVSSNLAQLIAHAGKRVILVDGDLRNPTLTRSLAPSAGAGILEVLSGKIDLVHAVLNDSQTGLDVLPAVVKSRLFHTNEILASETFKSLIDHLRKTYDYVIVDLPPIAPVVDVRGTVNVIDSYVYVIEWGRTRINVVQHQLGGSPEIQNRLLGVVLNKANVRVLERYEYYYGHYYHKKYYARYGYGYGS